MGITIEALHVLSKQTSFSTVSNTQIRWDTTPKCATTRTKTGTINIIPPQNGKIQSLPGWNILRQMGISTDQVSTTPSPAVKVPKVHNTTHPQQQEMRELYFLLPESWKCWKLQQWNIVATPKSKSGAIQWFNWWAGIIDYIVVNISPWFSHPCSVVIHHFQP